MQSLDKQHIIRLLKIANNDLPSVEHRIQGLERKESLLEGNIQEATRTLRGVSDRVSEESNALEQIRSSYKEKHLELTKLQIQLIRTENRIEQFQKNNGYLKIKQTVKQEVERALNNDRHLLKLAFMSVIDSCRCDPTKFKILYYNMPTSTTTHSILSAQNSQDDCDLSVGRRSQYLHPFDDGYGKLLLDKSEQFYNTMVEALANMCINKIVTESDPESSTSLMHYSKELPDTQASYKMVPFPCRRQPQHPNFDAFLK